MNKFGSFKWLKIEVRKIKSSIMLWTYDLLKYIAVVSNDFLNSRTWNLFVDASDAANQFRSFAQCIWFANERFHNDLACVAACEDQG